MIHLQANQMFTCKELNFFELNFYIIPRISHKTDPVVVTESIFHDCCHFRRRRARAGKKKNCRGQRPNARAVTGGTPAWQVGGSISLPSCLSLPLPPHPARVHARHTWTKDSRFLDKRDEK